MLLLWPSSALLAPVSVKSFTYLSLRPKMAALQSSAVFRRTNCEQRVTVRVAGVSGWGQSLPLLASSSARSFPGIPTWDEIHWATTFIPISGSFSIASIQSPTPVDFRPIKACSSAWQSQKITASGSGILSCRSVRVFTQAFNATCTIPYEAFLFRFSGDSWPLYRYAKASIFRPLSG